MKVTIYTLPECSGCRLLKTWLMKHSIEYEEKLLDNNIMTELICKYNWIGTTAPILEVDGKIYFAEELEKWMNENESIH